MSAAVFTASQPCHGLILTGCGSPLGHLLKARVSEPQDDRQVLVGSRMSDGKDSKIAVADQCGAAGSRSIIPPLCLFAHRPSARTWGLLGRKARPLAKLCITTAMRTIGQCAPPCWFSVGG